MKFPLKVEHRGHTAKIYAKSPRDGTYRTAWHSEGKRVQRNFKKLGEAKDAAMAALKNVARGEASAASLTPKKISEMKLAENVLRELGIPLLDAVTEYAAAKRLMPNTTLETAAKAYKENVTEIKRVSVELAAREYLADRKAKIGKKTYQEEELRLNRICQSLKVDLCDLSKSVLELFFSEEMRHLKGKSRNHFRQTFRQLFKFAVRRDYISKNHRLNEVLVNEPSGEAAPQILPPTKFKALLIAASPEMIPYVAISGMTGARRSEVLRLTWEDIWRVEGYIELEATKTKTKQRRLVPIQPALSEWLKPYRNNKGAIWKRSNGSFHSEFRRLRKSCKIEGHNLLRHSYASYRLAEIQNPTKVAVEMGNSPEKLYRNYNKLRTPKEAKEWFSSEHGLVTVG